MMEVKDYSPKKMQDLASMYHQELGEHAWDWIQRVLNQGGQSIKLDRKILLMWEHSPEIQDLTSWQGPQQLV